MHAPFRYTALHRQAAPSSSAVIILTACLSARRAIMANVKGLIRIMAPLAALCAALVGCAIGGTTTASTTPTASPTATPIPCATHATTTGVVWSEQGDKQVHGSIGGVAPAILSSFTYPLPGAAPYVDTGPIQISIAPDGRHMAVLQAQVVPNSGLPNKYLIYTVDTATHAVTSVGAVGTGAALMGWSDTRTLLYTISPFYPSHVATENLHFFNIATGANTTIPGVKGVTKAEARCSTLYWSEYVGTGIGKELLHRYNLATNTEIGAPIDLGKSFRLPTEYAGPDSETGGGDWDVSADNTTLVWQQLGTVTVDTNGNAVIGTSTYQKAAADGSGAATILATAPALARTHVNSLALSPTATLVAIAAEGVMVSGDIVAATTRSYTPNSPFITPAPAWLPDGSGFLANVGAGIPTNIYQYSVTGNLAGALAHANATGPETLP
jgi:hypothetical protein